MVLISVHLLLFFSAPEALTNVCAYQTPQSTAKVTADHPFEDPVRQSDLGKEDERSVHLSIMLMIMCFCFRLSLVLALVTIILIHIAFTIIIFVD